MSEENQEKSGKSLSEGESETAWAALGIDVPINPVEREQPPKIETQEKQNEEPSILLTQPEPEKNTQAPDWELVAKLSNLDQPVEGVPEAPDLEAVQQTDGLNSEETEEVQSPENELSEIEEEAGEEETLDEENQFSGVFQSTQLDDDDWAVGW